MATEKTIIHGMAIEIKHKSTDPIRKINVTTNNTLDINLGWLECVFKCPNNLVRHFYSDEHLIVILDGYLSGPESDLKRISEELINDPTRASQILKGSFFLCVIVPQEQKALFFTDRRNSRSYYHTQNGTGHLIASRVDYLATILNLKQQPSVDEEAVIQYLIRGAFYGTHTLFDDIHKIPCATILTYQQNKLSQQQYWRLQFNPSLEADQASENDLIEEGYELILAALKRSLNQFANPILFLSGGTDSRVLLGCLQGLKSDVPAITWGIQPIKEADDTDISIKLAQFAKVPHRFYEIKNDDYLDHIHQAIMAVDCRVDTLDAPYLTNLWESLGNSHDAFINGDEWFGWKNKVSDTPQALDALGWWNLDKVSRLADWALDEKRQKRNIEKTLKQLVDKTSTRDANDIKDSLYYHERIGNMLNSQLIGKFPFMEPIQPLLDEAVIDFVSRIPQSYRYDKRLLRLILKNKFPQFDKIAYATQKSLPTGLTLKNIVEGNPTLKHFIHNNLFDCPHESLAKLLNFNKIQAIYKSFYNNSEIPAIHLSSKVPGLWRLLPIRENRVHPLVLFFRILALNIYLNQFTPKPS